LAIANLLSLSSEPGRLDSGDSQFLCRDYFALA
jgi:hypothetical protein